MLALLWAVFGPTSPVLGPTWAHMEPSWRVLGLSWADLGANLGHPGAILGPTFAILKPSWAPSGHRRANNGVILGPFWNNFEAICQVELSSRSFHALSCPVASSTVYRARPLVCRVVKAVVSCAALADCFDSCIQTAIYTTLLQVPCRLTEFGRKSFQLSLS